MRREFNWAILHQPKKWLVSDRFKILYFRIILVMNCGIIHDLVIIFDGF